MTGTAIVRADGLVETALALVLVAGVGTDRIGARDFPDPAGTAVVLGLGCALLLAGAALWRLASAGPVRRSTLRVLAAANAATAAAALAWLLAADGFSTAGSALTAVTAASLAALAALQLRAAAGGPLTEP